MVIAGFNRQPTTSMPAKATAPRIQAAGSGTGVTLASKVPAPLAVAEAKWFVASTMASPFPLPVLAQELKVNEKSFSALSLKVRKSEV